MWNAYQFQWHIFLNKCICWFWYFQGFYRNSKSWSHFFFNLIAPIYSSVYEKKVSYHFKPSKIGRVHIHDVLVLCVLCLRETCMNPGAYRIIRVDLSMWQGNWASEAARNGSQKEWMWRVGRLPCASEMRASMEVRGVPTCTIASFGNWCSFFIW